MENNTQYMMLNKKLKDSKEKLKNQQKYSKKARKKDKDKGRREKSKFFEKYEKRLRSIQESDLKQKEKARRANRSQD